MVNFVSVDVGTTHIRVALVNENGRLKRIYKGPTDGKRLMQQVHHIIDSVGKFGGIGISMPGTLDMNRGILRYAPDLGIRDINIVEPMEKKYGVDVSLSNAGTSAVMGEKLLGAGKNLSSIVHLTLRTGIGCGVILNDRLLLGKDGNAHEVGHCTIDPLGAMTCSCGAAGHWEAYCSGRGIPDFTKELLDTKYKGAKSTLRGVKDLTAKKVYNAARSDKVAAKIVDEIGRLNAIGVANIIDFYDPELVSIGGGIAINNQSAVLKPILKHVKSHVMNRMPRVIITPLGENASLYGAVVDFLDL